MVVAVSIGSGKGTSICTNALGSSAPAAMIPRGRPRRMLLDTSCTPLASRAEASVSPGCPVWATPSKVKDSSTSRSIRPPAAVRIAVLT